MKNKGFTIIELLVVIAIIALLSALAVYSLNSARAKARDAKRASDIDQIFTALQMYYNDNGCLPITTGGTTCPGASGYLESNAGSWDYSSQGGFMQFLSTSGYMPRVPVDPINNMTGDDNGGYAYRYYCYPGSGLHLGYWKDAGGEVIKNVANGTWSDNSFTCR